VTVLVSVLLFGGLGIEESEVIPLVGGRLPVGIPVRDDFDRFKGASSAELMGGKSTCGVHLEAIFPSPKALIALTRISTACDDVAVVGFRLIGWLGEMRE